MRRKFLLAVSFLLVGALFAFPTTAHAIDSSSLASETILHDSSASPRRTPMPTTRTYLTSATARSTATGGFAYTIPLSGQISFSWSRLTLQNLR